eukprot:582465-Rhodomonas_salina.3
MNPSEHSTNTDAHSMTSRRTDSLNSRRANTRHTQPHKTRTITTFQNRNLPPAKTHTGDADRSSALASYSAAQSPPPHRRLPKTAAYFSVGHAMSSAQQGRIRQDRAGHSACKAREGMAYSCRSGRRVEGVAACRNARRSFAASSFLAPHP